MTPIRATYRLQLNRDLTFADATRLVPYLDDLGISHAYLSPILAAQKGSMHGYDTVDHARINPELGTMEDFRALAATLRARQMGLILDFVPNHMGVGGADNALWLDVLRHGPASNYANWFDIDWHPPRPGMDGKLLLPFLGKSYPEALTDGDLELRAEPDGLAIWAYGHEKLPIRPEDETALLARHGSTEAVLAAHREQADALDRLIARQHWRLAHFSTGADEINYRRFFINSELAGISIERAEVFDHVHSLIFALIAEGLIDGMRIDHIDGLRDPQNYLETLRAKAPRPLYLVVEKILAPHEYLRRDWPVDGTTGYEVGAQLTRLLIPQEAEPALTAAYEAIAGPVPAFAKEAYRCKLRVMDHELTAELDALARRAARLAWSAPATSDLTLAGLRRGLREIIAQMAVYRCYGDAQGLSPRDRRELGLAIARARRRPHLPPAIFDFFTLVFCGVPGPNYDAAAIAALTGRFQQYTGPVMAKGLEDTALYRYNRLVALNEVGAHPDRFSLSLPAFHAANQRRWRCHPHGLIATSTHDTKRGEDCRLLIAAIADDPELWIDAVGQWQKHLGQRAAALHPNDLYLFFQLLLGGWPISGDTTGLAERLTGAMLKSLREARQRSDWGVIDARYEKAVATFIATSLADEAFLARFHPVRAVFETIGRRKAIIQTVLKCTLPGLPDIYRGAEDWEQSFVDPDNRRALDFAALARRLANPAPGIDDKLALTQALLRLRRDRPALFAEASYEPLDLGPKILAFCRRHRGETLTVLADLSPGHTAPLPQTILGGTRIAGSVEGPVWVGVSP